MKKVLRIVGKRSESRRIGSGAFRRDVLAILEGDLGVEMDTVPPWLYRLVDLLEERYTPRNPSTRDQVHFMVALGSLVSATPPADAPGTISEAMHYLADPLGLRFDEEPELKFWPDSPEAGDHTCICSYCEEVIEEAPDFRYFNRENHTEARLHIECFRICSEFNLIPENVSGV